jgi:tetratricopeptide (TPR) repeat protein
MMRNKRRLSTASPRRAQRLGARRTGLSSNNGSRRQGRYATQTSRKLISAREAATRNQRRQSGRPSAEKQRSNLKYLAAIRNFEAGVRSFQKQNYEKAKAAFEKLAAGPASDVAARAQVYLRMCEQKLDRARAAPKTATDYYNLGVAQLNARNLEGAIEYLSKADALKPNQDYIRYALAAAHAVQGNAEAALEHLKVAVRLLPNNRFQARNDGDFQSLAADPRFFRLVYADDSPASG